VSSQKIFLFDFDGVIVDGMQEYWHSSLLACERYLNSPNITIDQKLYQGVPNSFKEIRPWVKYGWEMILIVHEIIKTENIISFSYNPQKKWIEKSDLANQIALQVVNNCGPSFGLIGKDGVNYFKSYFLEIYEKTTPDKNFSR